MSVTLLLDEITLKKMASFYADDFKENRNENAMFFAKLENVSITAYKKEKEGKRKVLFQGEDAEKEAAIWGYKKEEKKTEKDNLFGEIGSDEVGTGDFFGPVCVVAAYVPLSKRKRLKELGVADSKLLTDEKIREIGPILVKEFQYSSLTLGNEKYNEVNGKGLNMNAIKAKMHNRCLLNMLKKHPSASLKQDQFAAEKLYYSYLKEENEVARGIEFATKGETRYASVALASCIARYSFLIHMDELEKALGCKIPLGSGEKVDEFAKKIAKEKGLAVFSSIAKCNFSNFKKLL